MYDEEAGEQGGKHGYPSFALLQPGRIRLPLKRRHSPTTTLNLERLVGDKFEAIGE